MYLLQDVSTRANYPTNYKPITRSDSGAIMVSGVHFTTLLHDLQLTNTISFTDTLSLPNTISLRDTISFTDTTFFFTFGHRIDTLIPST